VRLRGGSGGRRRFEAVVHYLMLRRMDWGREALWLESCQQRDLLRSFRWIGVQAWGDSSISSARVIGGEHRHANQVRSRAGCV
jgi:hypothetical protein